MEGTLSDLNGLCNSKFLEKISPSLVARARLQQQLNAQENLLAGGADLFPGVCFLLPWRLRRS